MRQRAERLQALSTGLLNLEDPLRQALELVRAETDQQ